MKSTLLLTSALLAFSSAATWAQTPKDQPVQGTGQSFGESYLGSPPAPEEKKLATDYQGALDGALKKARAAVDTGNVEEAIRLFEEAKQIAIKAALVLHDEASSLTDPIEEESLIAQERYSEAIPLFERDPQQSTFSRAWLTVLYWRMGDTTKARGAFYRAFYRADKLDFSPTDGLGRFLALDGVTEETMQATALISMGAHINGGGDRALAQVELLKEAADFVPNDPYITYKIGEAYYHARQYKEALPYLHAAEPKMRRYIEEQFCEQMLSDCRQHLAAKNASG